MTARSSITRSLTCTLAPLVSVLAACSAPSATRAPAPLANHQPEPASERADEKTAPESQPAPMYGRFVGDNIGYEIRHFGRPVAGQIRLPAGMERRSNTNYADGYRVVSAVADQALVIFLTDADSVDDGREEATQIRMPGVDLGAARVPDAMVTQFQAVGTPEMVRERFQKYRDVGDRLDKVARIRDSK